MTSNWSSGISYNYSTITLWEVIITGLHLALRDPRTLGDVDFTIAHPNLPKIVHLPKKDQN